MGPLPRDEDGHILNSATYGQHRLVEIQIQYNTDESGKRIDAEVTICVTLDGPFKDDADTLKKVCLIADEWKDIAEERLSAFTKLVELTEDPDILRQVLDDTMFERLVKHMEEDK